MVQNPTEFSGCQGAAAALLPARGSMALLAGQSCAGKTALLASLVRHAVRREPIFGRVPDAYTAIGYMSFGRPWESDAGYWLGLNDVQIPHYSVVEHGDSLVEPSWKRQDWVRTLFNIADKHLSLPPGSLLNVDQVTLFLGDVNKYRQCAPALVRMHQELAARGWALVGTTAAGKVRRDPQQRYLTMLDSIMGSSAGLYGGADIGMYLAPPVESDARQDRYTLAFRPHRGDTETFEVGRNDDGVFALEDLRLKDALKLFQFVPEDGRSITRKELIRKWKETYPADTYVSRTMDRWIGKLERRHYVRRVDWGRFCRVMTH